MSLILLRLSKTLARLVTQYGKVQITVMEPPPCSEEQMQRARQAFSAIPALKASGSSVAAPAATSFAAMPASDQCQSPLAQSPTPIHDDSDDSPAP